MNSAAHRTDVDHYSPRFEATGKQYSYIAYLCSAAGITLETALETLWGMSVACAFSDRPWMRISRREASKVIGYLQAQIKAAA